MKKSYLWSMLMLSFLFISCQKDEALYSCDPEIDKWTKDNLDLISGMNREDILTYKNDIYLQKSIYSAMNPEQKRKIWKEKTSEVLKLSWTDKESLHIRSLLDIIEGYPEFFNSSLYSKCSDDIDLISYKWIKFAEEELKWNYNKIYAVSMTYNSININNGIIIVDERFDDNSYSIKTRSETNYACNCRKDSECAKNSNCLDVKCDVVGGCGFLSFQNCTGMCGKK